MKSIRPKPVDMKSLRLSPEEGFVLSRVDGPLSMRELVALTAMEESRIVAIVERLADEGALDVERDAPPAPTGDDELIEVTDELEEVHDDESREEERAEESAEAREDEAAKVEDVKNERLYRQLYETVFHPMDRDAKLAKATTISGSELLALCLDPDPVIIGALLTNPRAGIDHARMIALYHRNQLGLDHIAKRTDFVSDPLVQRRLLRNPQLPDAILRRLVAPKLLTDAYKISIDREIPERSRIKTRELLRKKFMLASADERAALLLKTEGRCLILLTGCALDAHTAQILCGKSTYGVLFVQNLARFSATPPMVLMHLSRQPVVRRNQGLRKLLLQHPNMPSEAKRNFGA